MYLLYISGNEFHVFGEEATVMFLLTVQKRLVVYWPKHCKKDLCSLRLKIFKNMNE